MQQKETWVSYLYLSFLSFFTVFLELLSLGLIEKILFRCTYNEYTIIQKSIHSFLTAGLWAISIATIVYFSYRHFGFPQIKKITRRISIKERLIALICLCGCKLITFIDWHTLKIVGEFRKKELVWFFAQYVYYIFEVALIYLIIIYGQKAFELLIKRKSKIPFGGILLASTWGVFHFVSSGVDFWNGFSCIIFSILSGIMYLALKRKLSYSYLFIALGYLL